MGELRQDLGFDDADAVYEALIDMIGDLDDDTARLVMAKLILLLANHVGDAEVIDQAIAATRKDVSD